MSSLPGEIVSLESLSSLLNKWEWVEYVSAAIVILGAVGEFLAEFTNLFRNEIRKRRLEKVSTIVLIAGLAVELVALVRTSQLSGQIIALLNQTASQANQRAAESEQFSEELKRQNLELQANVIKLQKELSWRTLQPKDHDFLAALKKFAGTRFTIRTYPEDPEAVSLANTIGQSLVEAGWVYLPTSHVMAFSLVMGVSIEVAPSHAAELEPAAKALASALNANGLDATEKLNEGEEHENHATMIHIRVGKKSKR